ncbi:dipeptidase PepV [Salipaludibacillus keqinensis]|uniref:Dipeptidase PepV n=1 Tax=Salipaludibacillus keqinensis TaxID=2045207 RepID=A0A323TEW5_9BACI|nr:dipeptidase PepV [Salipaludibacillus keqinensis]PYZ93812.1 dipeptidase PepV [Salipaludibacillus keqinensis]
MNWKNEVDKRKGTIVKDTQSFLQIESVLDEKTVSKQAPFGEKIREAYDWLLHKAKQEGFKVKDHDGYAAHIEWGTGEEIVGILCHIDVVPGGDDWTSPAFNAEIRDEKIYARGALDDKGPTMACYYALKILKDAGIETGKRVRLIIGTDEESQWRCVDHYFKHEEMPSLGFAPDADFPIIYAEKGICDFIYETKLTSNTGLVRSFHSGHRLNMVPDRAVAKLDIKQVENTSKLRNLFHQYLVHNDCKGSLNIRDSNVELTLNGFSAHGMEPEDGVNAGLLLAGFLIKLPLNIEEKNFITPLVAMFLKDSRGENIDIAYSDEQLGDLTINIGQMMYEQGSESKIGINLRYPEGASFDVIKRSLDDHFQAYGYVGDTRVHETPHAMDKDHELVKILSKVYEEETGEQAELLAIGGGTYARALNAGVAFGPLFPGQKDVIHQADEYISIKHLLAMTVIYTRAVYELAKR